MFGWSLRRGACGGLDVHERCGGAAAARGLLQALQGGVRVQGPGPKGLRAHRNDGIQKIPHTSLPANCEPRAENGCLFYFLSYAAFKHRHEPAPLISTALSPSFYWLEMRPGSNHSRSSAFGRQPSHAGSQYRHSGEDSNLCARVKMKNIKRIVPLVHHDHFK